MILAAIRLLIAKMTIIAATSAMNTAMKSVM
jgi:hypothetical protein